MFPVGLDKENP